MKRTLAGIFLGGVLVPAFAPAAHAGDPGSTAQAAAGDRRARIDLYAAAHAVTARADLSCAIGQEYEALAAGGDPRDHQLALLHYQRCLREGGPSTGLADVEGRIARLLDHRPDPTPSGSIPARPAPAPVIPWPAAWRVPVRISAYRPDRTYTVTLQPDATPAIPCSTPCTVAVPPGAARLHAQGAGEVDADILVPPRPGEIRIQARERGPLVIAGAVLIPTGVLMAATMWTVANACGQDPCWTVNLAFWPILGTATFVTGVVLLARGRALPDDANRVLLGGSRSLLDRASFGIAPLRGGAEGGVGFRF